MKLDVIKFDARTTMIDLINILKFFFKYSNELSIRTCTLKKTAFTITNSNGQIHYSKSLRTDTL